MKRTHRRTLAEGLEVFSYILMGAGMLLTLQALHAAAEGALLQLADLRTAVAVFAAAAAVQFVAGRINPGDLVLPAGARIVRAAEVSEGATIASARQLRDGSEFDLEQRDGWPVVLSVASGENEPGSWYVQFRLSSGDLPWLEPDDLVTVVPTRQPASV